MPTVPRRPVAAGAVLLARPRRRVAAGAVLLAVLAVTVPAAPAAAADCVVPSSDSYAPVPWPQLALAPERLWPLTRGAGVTVAVLDSGVDARSAQLAGRVLPGIAATPSAGPPDRDCTGHGTAAAGIVAAAPARGTGFAGIAPAARVLPVLLGDRSATDPAVLATGITAAVAAGARVVLVSARPTGDDRGLRAAVAAAARADVLVVAGTDATDGTAYPAAYPGVLAVAGVGPAGTGGATGDVGAAPPPGQRVDLVAPAGMLVTLGVGRSGQVGATGAGMAAAFVAGTAALLRAYRPRMTAAEVRARLLATAAPAGGPVPHPRWGHGSLDPYAAVTALAPPAGRVDTPPVRVVPPVRAAPPDTSRRDTAALLGLAALAAAGLCAAAVVVARRGRDRRWHPA